MSADWSPGDKAMCVRSFQEGGVNAGYVTPQVGHTYEVTDVYNMRDIAPWFDLEIELLPEDAIGLKLAEFGKACIWNAKFFRKIRPFEEPKTKTEAKVKAKDRPRELEDA